MTNVPTSAKKLGRIVLVLDPKLSRQKSLNLTRLCNRFRVFAEVKLLAATTTEAQLLQDLDNYSPHLVLAPWHNYLSWKKIEGYFGLTRSSGPTFAGYHCGELHQREIGATADDSRIILLDFDGTSPEESALLVRSLISDETRSGILPLVGSNANIRFDSWLDGHTLGSRMDAVLSLPQIENGGWSDRANSIRILLTSFWGLIFEESTGVATVRKQVGSSAPRASLQIGISNECFALRLCYSMSTWTPKDTVDFFWPRPEAPTSSAQLLLRHADVLRVHRLVGSGDVEVVAALFKSAGAEKAPQHLQTFWIEPLQDRLVSEELYPERKTDPMRFLPPKDETAASPSDSIEGVRAQIIARDRKIEELRVTLQEIKAQLFARESYIAELKYGGIGSAAPASPPDTDSLLAAFYERFMINHDQIMQLIEETERPPSEWSADYPKQKLRLAELCQREETWVRKLAEILRTFQDDRARLNSRQAS